MDDLNKPLTARQGIEREAQLSFLKKIFESQLPVYLVGGLADDALLHKKATRRHQDVDFLASRHDSDLLIEELSRMGYRVREEGPVPLRESPYKLSILGNNIKAEVVFYDRDQNGESYVALSNPMMGERLRVYVDMKEAMPAQQINGIEVKTVSTLTLIRLKDEYHQAGAPESNPQQVRTRNRLIDKFYPGENPDSDKFKLRIEKE